MNIVEVSFYDLVTGEIVRIASLDEDTIAAETQPGHGVVGGIHNALNRVVDLKRGEVVAYQPPQPSDKHEWNQVVEQWQLTDLARAEIEKGAQVQEDIERKEKDSLRAMREVLLDPGVMAVLSPKAATAAAKLQTVDDEIGAVKLASADAIKARP